MCLQLRLSFGFLGLPISRSFDCQPCFFHGRFQLDIFLPWSCPLTSGRCSGWTNVMSIFDSPVTIWLTLAVKLVQQYERSQCFRQSSGTGVLIREFFGSHDHKYGTVCTVNTIPSLRLSQLTIQTGVEDVQLHQLSSSQPHNHTVVRTVTSVTFGLYPF